MRINSFLTVLAALLLSACAGGPPAPLPTLVPAENEAYRADGAGTIIGQAYQRSTSGEIQYGSGGLVYLFPNTAYFNAWVKRKSAPWGRDNIPKMAAASAAYVRTVSADDQGYFTFPHLPDGSYLLFTELYVEGGGSSDPYLLNHPDDTVDANPVSRVVEIKGGQTVKVILN